MSSIEEQTYRNIEVLIVDAHSTDDTVEVSGEYDTEIYQRDLKRSAARLYGAKHASGEYLCHIDSDMILGAAVIDECICILKGCADAVVIPEYNIGQGLGGRAMAFEKRYLAKCSRGYLRFLPSDVYFNVGGHHPELVSGEDKYLHDSVIAEGFTVDFAENKIIHDTGKHSLIDAMRDRFEYSETTGKKLDKLGDDYQEEDNDWTLLCREMAFSPIAGSAFVTLEIAASIARIYQRYSRFIRP